MVSKKICAPLFLLGSSLLVSCVSLSPVQPDAVLTPPFPAEPSAASTIHVVLFGLSMLVPNTGRPPGEAGEDKAPTGMTAVMPDSTAQQVSSDGCRIPLHEPVVLTKDAEIWESPLAKENSLRADLLSRDGYSGGWRLRGFEVRLKLYERATNLTECAVQGTAISLPFDMNPHDTEGEGAWPQGQASASKVGWLWRGSSSLQRRGVSVECLVGSQRACPVASRLIVTAGSVRVCRLAAVLLGGHNVPVAEREYQQGFQSQEQGDQANMFGRSRPLPTAVRLSLPTVSESAVLVVAVRKLGDSTDQDYLRLCPKVGEDQVWIGNTPMGNHPYQSEYCSHHDVDRHFELFYLLQEQDAGQNEADLASDREVPKATNNRRVPFSRILQPKDECIVPALFLDGTGHVPELTAVCGKAQGKPNWAAGRD